MATTSVTPAVYCITGYCREPGTDRCVKLDRWNPDTIGKEYKTAKCLKENDGGLYGSKECADYFCIETIGAKTICVALTGDVNLPNRIGK